MDESFRTLNLTHPATGEELTLLVKDLESFVHSAQFLDEKIRKAKDTLSECEEIPGARHQSPSPCFAHQYAS